MRESVPSAPLESKAHRAMTDEHPGAQSAGGVQRAEPEHTSSTPAQRSAMEEKNAGTPVQRWRERKEEERPSGMASVAYRKSRDNTDSAGTVTRKSEAEMDAAATRAVATKDTGNPLRPHVRQVLESRMGVDLSGVRVHEGPAAQEASAAIHARAFTHKSDIWLGRGESQENIRLMAHEATHVVQQGAATRRAPGLPRRGEEDVAQRESPPVAENAGPPRVQRLGLSDVLDYISDKANLIPGFRMFTIVLGVNPINMSPVDRSAANILRAVVEFIPGGALITQALDAYGVFDKVGNWVEQQIATLNLVGSSIKRALSDFLDSLSLSDIVDPGGVWDRAKRIFTEPIDRIKNFVSGLANDIIKFIKDAILMPLARLAEGTRGWDLLIAVLGKNPITGDEVPRTPETLIGGFMKLIGQEEVWNNLQRSNAVPRAWAWFQGALGTILAFVTQIPSLFVSALKSLVLEDLILLPRAFAKVAGVFANFIGDFMKWAGDALWELLQIIFEVVAPGAIPYLKKVGAAFKTILKNPIAFIGNLVKAAKLGFEHFADNILAHLKASFIEWLTGSLEGVYIPKSLDFREIVAFVLSVLGLTWQNVRQKLVKAVGEPVVKTMETGFDIVVTLVKDGPAAAWDKIKEHLGNLKDMVMQGIMDFVVDTIVKKAIAKLVSLFVPGGAFIQAIVSIYDTIMVFIDKLAKIIQVATAFLDSMIEIANGAIGNAANKVENTMAGLLTLAINFLAGFLGLGKIADKVQNIINTKVRQPIDKALDAVISWIVVMAKKLFAKVFGKDGKPDERTDDQKKADLHKGVTEGQSFLKQPGATPASVRAALPPIQSRNKLASLTLIEHNGKYQIKGEVNPEEEGDEVELEEAELSEDALWDKAADQINIEPPPQTVISPSSLSYTRTVLETLIQNSPASAARKTTALGLVASRLDQAAAATDGDTIYRFLQQAGGIVSSLYPGSRPAVVIHHEQEVAEFQDTFVDTRKGRMRVSKSLRADVKARVASAKGLSAPQKKAAEEELINLIKEQAMDRQKQETERPLPEVDLIAVTERVHIEIHRRRQA